MAYIKPDKLYCFSPPVMMATFLIEVSLAMYTLWRYKLNSVTRVSTAILVCLAVFQLAEYNVCENGILFDSATWARLGYVAITLLPPLGIHLASRLSGDKRRWPYISAYVLGGMFVTYFLFATGGISAGVCLGNYVIFEQGHNTGYIYGLYYYGLLLATIVYAFFQSMKTRKQHIRNSLYALSAGYILFMLPTTLVNVVDPATIMGIPSIMCGFAVLLAVVLVDRVLPAYHEHNSPLVIFHSIFARK